MEQVKFRRRGMSLLVRIGCLFFGQFGIVGWGFFAFGSLFTAMAISQTDMTGWYEFSGELTSVKGVIVEDEKSVRAHEVKKSEPYKYEFADLNGMRRSGLAYSDELHHNGDLVDVEYPAGHPEKSRVRGMRRKSGGSEGLWTLIFPGVGLLPIIAQFFIGRRQSRLLSTGVITLGVLVDKYKTVERDSDGSHTFYHFKFEFITVDGRKRCALVSTQSPKSYSGERLTPAQKELADRIIADGAGSSISPYIMVDGVRYIEDDSQEAGLQDAARRTPAWLRKFKARSFHRNAEELQELRAELAASPVIEPLVYDPRDPNIAMMLDEFPGSPRLAADGSLFLAKGWKIMLALLMPIFAVVANVAGYLSAN